MAKNRDDRKAQREQKRQQKETQKAQEAGDLKLIKAADESAKASIKAREQKDRQEKKGKRKGLPPTDVGPAKFNDEPQPTRVARTSINPETGEQEATQYMSIADYAKANPSDAASSTLDGKDPKTDVQGKVIDKSSSYSEMKSGQAISQAVQDQVDNVNEDADKSEFVADAGAAQRSEQQVQNTETGETKTTQGGYEKFPGEGGTLGGIARDGSGQYELTDEQYAQLGQQHRAKNAAAKASAPAAAIEALGIEQYYPPQQDYITSNFTGRYIGSRQLVAATGALFPEGLTDARNRAKQARAKAKAELDEKFWELGSTTPQYDERYKDIGMDMLDKFYELADGDIESLLSGKSKLSRQFMRELYDFESRGKNLESINTSIEALVEKMNEGTEYIPPEIIKNMYDFRAGTADLDSYMQGKGIGDEKVRRMINTLRSYQNFTPLADKKIELLKGLGGDKLPLNKNADWSDPEFASNMQEAISGIKNKGVGYDEYIKVMGEFYDVEAVETIVRDIYRTNTLYEGTTDEEFEQEVQSGVKYFMAMLPDKIDIEQKLQSNESLGWASLAERKRQYNTSREDRIREQESLWDDVNNDMLSPDMRSKVLEALSRTKDPKARAKMIQWTYTENDKSAFNLGGIAVAKIPTRGITTAYANSNDFTVLGSDGKLHSIDKMIEWRETRLQNSPKGSTKYKDAYEELQELRKVKNQNGDIQHQVSGRYAGYGVYEAYNNSYTPIEHYDGLVYEGNIINIGYETGKIGIEGDVGPDGKIAIKPSKFTYVTNANIEADEVRRAYSNREAGEEIRKSSYPSEGSTVVSTSTSSGSNE